MSFLFSNKRTFFIPSVLSGNTIDFTCLLGYLNWMNNALVLMDIVMAVLSKFIFNLLSLIGLNL